MALEHFLAQVTGDAKVSSNQPSANPQPHQGDSQLHLQRALPSQEAPACTPGVPQLREVPVAQSSLGLSEAASSQSL